MTDLPREQDSYDRDPDLGEAADQEQDFAVAVNAQPGDVWDEHEGTRILRRARGQGFVIDARSNGGPIRLQGDATGGVVITAGKCRIVVADGQVTVEAETTATIKAPIAILDSPDVRLGGASASHPVVYQGCPCPVNPFPFLAHAPGSTTVKVTP